jgi:hypothetical protein
MHFKSNDTWKNYINEVVEKQIQDFRVAKKAQLENSKKVAEKVNNLGFAKTIQEHPKQFKNKYTLMTKNIISKNTSPHELAKTGLTMAIVSEVKQTSKYVNHYRLKPVASITLAKQINEMKSQNYLVCDAFLVLQYIFVLVAHLDFPLSQQNNL